MFKLSIRICFLLILLSKITLSQDEIPCGTDENHQYLMEHDENYFHQFLEHEAILKDYILNNPEFRTSTDLFVIPVVVHVIHLGEPVGTANNISDAQIIGAIQGLNNRFRNTNGNGSDFNMEFCLAVRDPNNQPTTGILRVDGSGVEGYSANGINFSTNTCGANETALKNLSRWPVNQYYNIWVVNKICGNYAGYAYYPFGGQNDGTVMARTYMTQGNTTLAHELGHGFNLFHTFNGDDSNTNCPLDASCIDQGDRICDTPPHKQGDCGGSNPCPSEGIWNNSRNNYMSYCGTKNRFTAGQRERSRAAAVLSPRLVLLNSLGCVPVTSIDIGITTIHNPIKQTVKKGCGENLEVPSISVSNFGTDPITNFMVAYNVNNQPTQYFNWTGNLLNNESVLINLDPVLLNNGINNISFTLENPNNSNDQFLANNSKMFEFNFAEASIENTEVLTAINATCQNSNDGSANFNFKNKFELKTDFETDDHGWLTANGAQPNKWVVGNAVASEGNRSIYISDNNIDNQYNTATTSFVHFYKDFYFPEWASDITLSFDWRNLGENVIDYFKVSFADVSHIPAAGNFGFLPTVGLTQYLNQEDFTTYTISNIQSLAGTYKRIVFSWRNNNNNIGNQPPAAIDNITISYEFNQSPVVNWSTGNIGPFEQNLSVGSYSVEASNAIGCAASLNFEIAAPEPLNLEIEANGEIQFCPSDSVLLQSTDQLAYLWSNGIFANEIYVNAIGTYYTSIITEGCTYTSNPIEITHLPAPETPVITLVGNTLQSSDADNFQWFYNNILLEGETSSTLNLTEYGIYKVKVTNELGCFSYSDSFIYDLTSSITLNKDAIHVFPNPANQQLNFTNLTGNQNFEIKVFNTVGALLLHEKLMKPNLDISSLNAGIYLIEILNGDYRFNQRFVKL